MIRVQNKISDGLEVLQYFTTHRWIFRNEKFLAVRDEMVPEEKKSFDIDFKSVDHIEYMKNCMVGARLYCIKDPLETLPKARRLMKM